MKPTKNTEPLLSDEDVELFRDEWANGGKNACYAIRAIYEADRAKTRAVVQELVDALKDGETTAIACHEILPYAMDRPDQKWNKAVEQVIDINTGNIEQMSDALALAASIGIEPQNK